MSESNLETPATQNYSIESIQLQTCIELVKESENYHLNLNDMGIYEKDRPDFIEEMDKQCPQGRDKDFIVGMLERNTTPIKTSGIITCEFTIYNIPESSIPKLKDADTERKVKFYTMIIPKEGHKSFFAGFASSGTYVKIFSGYNEPNMDPLCYLESVIKKLGDDEDSICYSMIIDRK